MLATGRVNYPDPGTLEDGWHNAVFNGSTGSIQLQATATTYWRDTAGGMASEIVVPPGQGVKVYNTATVWLAVGLSATATQGISVNDTGIVVVAQMFS